MPRMAEKNQEIRGNREDQVVGKGPGTRFLIE